MQMDAVISRRVESAFVTPHVCCTELCGKLLPQSTNMCWRILENGQNGIGVICSIGILQECLDSRCSACSLTVAGASSSAHVNTAFGHGLPCRKGHAVRYCPRRQTERRQRK